MTDKPLCFVIAPIGERGSEARKQSDIALEYIIRPALESTYYVKRADTDERPGEITKQMVVDIEQAAMIVCNLSGLNANVMYELGIAHARQKKVIHIFDSKTTLPFDLRQSRSIEFDVSDPSSHRMAADQLAKYEGALKQSDAVSNPFTEAMAGPIKLDKEDLKDKTIGSLLEEMEDLASRLTAIEDAVPGAKRGSVKHSSISHVDGAGKLIDLLADKPGFNRIVLDERGSKKVLIVYGTKELNLAGLPDELDGMPIEYRLT